MSSYDGKLGQERAKITTKGLGRGARLWGKKWQIYERKYKITKEKQQKNMRKIVYLLEFKLLQKKKGKFKRKQRKCMNKNEKKKPKDKSLLMWKYKKTKQTKKIQIHKFYEKWADLQKN